MVAIVMRLDSQPTHRDCEVVEVTGQATLAQRLMAMGFLPGCRVRIVNVAPFGDPITVQIDGWRVSLRRADAALVQVRANGSRCLEGKG